MLPLFLYSLIISVGGDLFAATVPVFLFCYCYCHRSFILIMLLLLPLFLYFIRSTPETDLVCVPGTPVYVTVQ